MPSKLKIKATSALSTNKSVRQFHYLTVKRDKLCRKSSQRDPRTSKHSKEEGEQGARVAAKPKQILQQIAVKSAYLSPVDSWSWGGGGERRVEASFSQVAARHTQLAASSRLALLIELQKLRRSVCHITVNVSVTLDTSLGPPPRIPLSVPQRDLSPRELSRPSRRTTHAAGRT